MPKLNKIYTRKQIDAIREELIAKHGDICAICKEPRASFKNRLSVDHNHKSGQVRGLLCYYCNKFKVGRHNLESSKEVYEYLHKYEIELNLNKYTKEKDDIWEYCGHLEHANPCTCKGIK